MNAKKNKVKIKETASDLSANVSVLKTHLSQYLKKVKQGLEIIVYDRQLPVAKLIPFNGDTESLVEIAPTVSWHEIHAKLVQNNKTKSIFRLKRDSLYYLGEDRGIR